MTFPYDWSTARLWEHIYNDRVTNWGKAQARAEIERRNNPKPLSWPLLVF